MDRKQKSVGLSNPYPRHLTTVARRKLSSRLPDGLELNSIPDNRGRICYGESWRELDAVLCARVIMLLCRMILPFEKVCNLMK